MTALFDPVEIGNTTVSRATLHNCDFFNALELGEGDVITVTKFNEIIPGIMSNETKSGTYQLIDKCPSCGEKLIIKNTGTANVLYCQNDNCSSRKLAQFEHFVSKHCMDVRGMSSATLETLISHGFLRNFKDIYHLSDHRQQLIRIDGFGQKSVDNLLKSIEDSRNVKLENFIAALGIEGIGVSASKTIAKHCNHDVYAIFDADDQSFDWTTLDDIGPTMAKNINEFFDNNFSSVFELAKELNFIKPEQKSDTSLDGIKFCITGSFSRPRDELKRLLEDRGAKFVSSVSKNLDIIFAGDKAGSKLTKAQQLGVRVANEADLMQMIE